MCSLTNRSLQLITICKTQNKNRLNIHYLFYFCTFIYLFLNLLLKNHHKGRKILFHIIYNLSGLLACWFWHHSLAYAITSCYGRFTIKSERELSAANTAQSSISMALI